MASSNEMTGFGRGGRGAALLQALARLSQKPGTMTEEWQDLKSPYQAEKNILVEQQTRPGCISSEATHPVGRGFTYSGQMPLMGQGLMSDLLPAMGRGLMASSSLSLGRGITTDSLPSMGRGAHLTGQMQPALESKQILQQPFQNTVESSLGPAPQTPSGVSGIRAFEGQQNTGSRPLGRGLAAMKQLIAQQEMQKSAFFGRGRLFSTQEPQQKPEPERTLVNEMGDLKLKEVPVFREKARLPTVSKLGTEGDPASLSANYVKILCKNQGVYLYHVTFSPAIDNKRLKIRLLLEHKDKFKTVNSFDGSVMYLPFQLPDKETIVTSIRKTDGAPITITVTFIKVVPPEQCCHLYNVVFRRIMAILKMCQVGKYYYNPHASAVIPQHKLEVWPGYITAIHEHEGGLLLLLDASHRVLRQDTVHEILEHAIQTNEARFQDEIIRKVVGHIVLTRYNNKTYRVDDIAWDKTPLDRFECRATGEIMAFQDYYKKHYNITIRDKEQPLLLSKRKPPKGAPPGFKPDPEFLCLVPELCSMTGLTDDLRQQFTVMKDLAVHTRVTPAQRQFAMKKFIHSVNNSPEARAELAVWGIDLDSSTISIAGRILPSEKISIGQKSFFSGPQADWSREISRSVLTTPVTLENWGLFYTRRDANKANDFVKHMQSEGRNLGIMCHAPFRRELGDEKNETLVQELRRSINQKVQLVVVINPTNRDDRYAAIKKICCVEAPVPSQVIVARTISRPDKLRSVVQKIALQINCKLGGELWTLNIPLEKLMVVGIDTYHDSAKSRNSVAGFVASTNRSCTRWYSNVCFQRPGQELVHGLQICLINALRKYYTINHFLPDKIVIFRDGVGDGQLDVLADHEVKQLQRCFGSFDHYNPQCTTICVQKRINTRIYRKERDGEMANPVPGTVVDHTITRRERYDFFIVSQHVRQGTVSPTHYIVVEDGLDLKPGLMQRLTYKMTHLYYNWPGTVRVPAPCQYAHKLAYLVGESIHKEPAECLSDRLFFL